MTEAAAAGEIIIRYTCKLESGQIDAVEKEEEEEGKRETPSR